MFRRLWNWLMRIADEVEAEERAMSYEDQVARHETPVWWRRRRRRGLPVS